MQRRSVLSVGSWVGIALIIWTLAWIVAESIPVFNDLLSLIVRTAQAPIPSHWVNVMLTETQSSLFGSTFSCELQTPFLLPLYHDHQSGCSCPDFQFPSLYSYYPFEIPF